MLDEIDEFNYYIFKRAWNRWKMGLQLRFRRFRQTIPGVCHSLVLSGIRSLLPTMTEGKKVGNAAPTTIIIRPDYSLWMIIGFSACHCKTLPTHTPTRALRITHCRQGVPYGRKIYLSMLRIPLIQIVLVNQLSIYLLLVTVAARYIPSSSICNPSDRHDELGHPLSYHFASPSCSCSSVSKNHRALSRKARICRPDMATGRLR